MLGLQLRRLCGKCSNYSMTRSLCTKNVGSSASNSSTIAETKQTDDDVMRESSKAFAGFEDNRVAVAKGLFMNEVNEEMLAFPEVIEKESLDTISEASMSKLLFFRQRLSIAEKNAPALQQLKEFGVFRYNVDSKYGGLGYTTSETVLASEPEGYNTSIALALIAHRSVCDAINRFGNAHQKQRYLPLLASGGMMATSCVEERDIFKASQSGSMATASLDDDTGDYILNGTKNYVVNSINSQLFLVYAQTRTKDVLGDANDSITAFLVEADAPGVSIEQRDETIGSQQLYQSSVKFTNVRVKPEAWLSTPGDGHTILQTYLTEKRFQYGIINVAQMKSILGSLVDLCRNVENRSSNNAGNLEHTSLRDAIARISTSIYASESIIFLTAGIDDIYENADLGTESAIVKVYTQEKLYDAMTRACSFMDMNCTIKDDPMREKVGDVLQLQSYDETKDSLKMYIGISGVQHCGYRLVDDIKKKRNPLMYPDDIMRSMFHLGSTMDKVRLKLDVKKNLHHVLDPAIQSFEESVARLNMGADILMTEFARNLPQEHCKILRLADAAILNYVTLATLSRASRAICHKFETAQNENTIAALLSEDHRATIYRLMKELEVGEFNSYDMFYQKVAKLLVKENKYFVAHPLTRFF